MRPFILINCLYKFNSYITGYTFLPKALVKEHSPTVLEHVKKIVDSLQNEEIETEKLSKILQDHGLIKEIDVQDINTEFNNSEEEKAALIVLIDRVVTPPPDVWFIEFLSCLREAGYEEAVQRINPRSSGEIQGGF